MTRFALLLVLCAAGCDDENERERRRRLAILDTLTRERGHLAAHQTNLRAAADAELAGRPPDALPPDAAARLAGFQQQYEQADRRLRAVDLEIDSTRHDLATLP